MYYIKITKLLIRYFFNIKTAKTIKQNLLLLLIMTELLNKSIAMTIMAIFILSKLALLIKLNFLRFHSLAERDT